jgi:hypothetical protein
MIVQCLVVEQYTAKEYVNAHSHLYYVINVIL